MHRCCRKSGTEARRCARHRRPNTAVPYAPRQASSPGPTREAAPNPCRVLTYCGLYRHCQRHKRHAQQHIHDPVYGNKQHLVERHGIALLVTACTSFGRCPLQYVCNMKTAKGNGQELPRTLFWQLCTLTHEWLLRRPGNNIVGLVHRRPHDKHAKPLCDTHST